jgi:hypothetical protein
VKHQTDERADEAEVPQMLWEARSWELGSPEATEQFRTQLDDVQKQDW